MSVRGCFGAAHICLYFQAMAVLLRLQSTSPPVINEQADVQIAGQHKEIHREEEREPTHIQKNTKLYTHMLGIVIKKCR